jgi:hypothetical protein
MKVQATEHESRRHAEMARYDEITDVLSRTTVRPTVIERKPRSDKAQGVPELDQYVEQSYMEEEALELRVPTRYAKDTERLIRRSVKALGAARGEDIRVTLKAIEGRDGKTTVQFYVRPVLEMGRRAWKAKQEPTVTPRTRRRRAS